MHLVTYSLIRFFGFFISFLPYTVLHAMGRLAGNIAFFLYRPYRKKALSNVAIAYGAKKSEEERQDIARKSFQNLMITLLEFFKLKRSRGKFSNIVEFEENPELRALLENKQGVIFLTGHLANWEIPFIAITERYKGIAIGRPIRNKWLYRWILSVREMHGGKIVMPRNAIRQGIKALKRGEFLGIVGDQAFPESPYAYSLLGTRAWTATTPAILAYKAHVPLVAISSRREEGKHIVSTSRPFWPDLSKPLKEETVRLMNLGMSHLEAKIDQKPHEWMWIHDRWKQQRIDHVKREFRYGFILIALPPVFPPEIYALFRQIYPRSFLTFLIPKNAPKPPYQAILYEKESDLCLRDWRYQLFLDLYGSKAARKHFRRLGAVKTVYFPAPDPDLIRRTLIKGECLNLILN